MELETKLTKEIRDRTSECVNLRTALEGEVSSRKAVGDAQNVTERFLPFQWRKPLGQGVQNAPRKFSAARALMQALGKAHGGHGVAQSCR